MYADNGTRVRPFAVVPKIPERCANKKVPCQPGYNCEDRPDGPVCVKSKTNNSSLSLYMYIL